MLITLAYVLIALGFEETTNKFWSSIFWPATVGRILAKEAIERGLFK